jgi:hypothetical protein
MRNGPSRLTIDCDICGEPMKVDRLRYAALIKAGERPRCRKNGCERLCGAKHPATSRSAEGLPVQKVGVLTLTRTGRKKSRKPGALEKLRVTRASIEDYAAGRENV